MSHHLLHRDTIQRGIDSLDHIGWVVPLDGACPNYSLCHSPEVNEIDRDFEKGLKLKFWKLLNTSFTFKTNQPKSASPASHYLDSNSSEIAPSAFFLESSETAAQI